MELTLKVYQTASGKQPFREWILSLPLITRAKLNTQINKLRNSDFTNYKRLKGSSIYELRIHVDGGYRVYFGKDGEEIIVLLAGGDKSTQERDIKRAVKLWQDYVKERA